LKRKQTLNCKHLFQFHLYKHPYRQARQSLVPQGSRNRQNGYCQSSGIEIINPEVCSAILCNYNQLKWTSKGHFDGDTYYLMEDFDRVYKKAMEDQPLYKRIAECKIDGM
jgi:hypothetical protein